MSKDVAFVLDIDAAGLEILQQMAQPTIKKSGQAILFRAASMASSMTSNPPTFSIEDKIGIIKKGTRAITTVSAPFEDNREEYIAHVALAKAKDAGRIN
jgi:hypothetical protein